MIRLEDLGEHVDIVRCAGEISDALPPACQRLFLRIFDEARWNADKMKQALAEGFSMFPAGKSPPVYHPKYYPRHEEHLAAPVLIS